MIEDIKLIGIDDKFYNNMIETLGYDLVLNLACNYEKIKENIGILKSFNILVTNDLLLYKPEIFLKNSEDLVKKFSKFNIPVIVNLINEDYTVIDEIL